MMKYTRFTSTGLLVSAAVLALPSCRIINGKPDFNWITDQFTPVVDDSVVVDRGVGALDIPATEIQPPAEAIPPIPPPAPKPSPVAQVQPQPPAAPQTPVPQTSAPQQPTVYTVVAGDTLSAIAARHHTKTKVLIELNKLDINKPLQLNQKLLIPAKGEVLPPVSGTAVTQQQQQEPGYFSRLFGQNTPTGAEARSQSHIIYSVVAGDTLSAIARRHGTRTKTLIDLNRLDINRPLQINQKLLIPAPGGAARAPHRTVKQENREANPPARETESAPQQQPESAGTPVPETESAPTPLPQQSPAPQTGTVPPAGANSYTIQPGDTLFGIARKLNITPDKLMEVNGLTPETADKLQAGATLNLPTQKQP